MRIYKQTAYVFGRGHLVHARTHARTMINYVLHRGCAAVGDGVLRDVFLQAMAPTGAHWIWARMCQRVFELRGKCQHSGRARACFRGGINTFCPSVTPRMQANVRNVMHRSFTLFWCVARCVIVRPDSTQPVYSVRCVWQRECCAADRECSFNGMRSYTRCIVAASAVTAHHPHLWQL